MHIRVHCHFQMSTYRKKRASIQQFNTRNPSEKHVTSLPTILFIITSETVDAQVWYQFLKNYEMHTMFENITGLCAATVARDI